MHGLRWAREPENSGIELLTQVFSDLSRRRFATAVGDYALQRPARGSWALHRQRPTQTAYWELKAPLTSLNTPSLLYIYVQAITLTRVLSDCSLERESKRPSIYLQEAVELLKDQ